MKLQTTERLESSEGGFALAAVIFVLVLLGVLAVTSFVTTGDERRASVGMRESAKAFYAAEAGVNLVVAQWDSLQYDTLFAAPGDSANLGWQTLPENGTSFWAMLYRIDDGGQARYALEVEGRAAGGGQRGVSVVLGGTSTVIALNGAFQFAGNATIGDGSGFNGGPPVVIDGNDNVPPGWDAVCDPPGPAVPGLSVSDATAVDFADGPTILGNPPMVESPFDVAAFDALYDLLVSQATNVYTTGQKPGSVQPAVNNNVCDTSVIDNWGAPEDPTHPCFDHFPIIYAVDDFKVTLSSGQGILLTDGDAQFENGFNFYGLVMARNSIQVEQGKSGCEPANIWGGMYTRNDASDVKLWGPKWYPGDISCNGTEPGSSLRYSSCAMQRIADLSLAGSAGAAIVNGSWTEIWQ